MEESLGAYGASFCILPLQKVAIKINLYSMQMKSKRQETLQT